MVKNEDEDEDDDEENDRRRHHGRRGGNRHKNAPHKRNGHHQRVQAAKISGAANNETDQASGSTKRWQSFASAVHIDAILMQSIDFNAAILNLISQFGFSWFLLCSLNILTAKQHNNQHSNRIFQQQQQMEHVTKTYISKAILESISIWSFSLRAHTHFVRVTSIRLIARMFMLFFLDF